MHDIQTALKDKPPYLEPAPPRTALRRSSQNLIWCPTLSALQRDYTLQVPCLREEIEGCTAVSA